MDILRFLICDIEIFRGQFFRMARQKLYTGDDLIAGVICQFCILWLLRIFLKKQGQDHF